jgi:glutaredoxin 3
MSVTVYTKGGCTYCVRAKRLLTQRGVTFREVNLDHVDRRDIDALIESTNCRTVPQIFINGNFIGGFDALEALDMKGELEDFKPID